ncbi:MAG TPA: HEAT repeat domain-containing protein [Thermoanaerobaculia bacterium]|nr:HEAT repeat domain-containing protein [Thermoanaerobaculia bacterium]
MRSSHRFCCLLLLPLIFGDLSFTSWGAPSEPGAAAEEKDDVYREAKRDLDAGRFGQAAEKFGRVAGRGGASADAALYWQAYAYSKAGRSKDALSTVRRLAGSHPKSPWLDDARALEAEIRGTAGEDDAGEDAELRLIVLGSRLERDPAGTIPKLQAILRGSEPLRVKRQALFVLSQSGAPEARRILVEVARGSAHPELQKVAIEYLGILQDKEAQKTLQEIYRTNPSPEIRRHVLEYLGISQDHEFLARTARQEKDPALRRQAITSLGLGPAGKTGEILLSLYRDSDGPARRAVIEALFIQSNAKALIDLARAEKNPALRREIVQHLSLMNSQEAQDFLSKAFDH